MKNTIQKIVISSMFAALTCVMTMVVKIPSPLNGYINLGDCMVLLCGWILSPGYAFLAAGIGSALADLFAGYAAYLPATFIIKGCMAICAFIVFKLLDTHLSDIIARILSGISAEIIMVGGYFIFEGFMYGFLPSVPNIIPNMLQGAVGIIIGIIIIKIFEKHNITALFK